MIPRLIFALLAAMALIRASKPWPYSVETEPDAARAVLLHPRNTTIRTAYALALEKRGNVAEAELQLLEAARTDRQYAPAWQLSDFYFRQRRTTDFLTWAHVAAERSYEDLGALFRLANALEISSDQIERYLLVKPGIERNYIAWLIEHKLLQDIAPVAKRLAKRSQPEDREMLLAYVDALIAEGRAKQAREAWKLVDSSDGTVTNPTFTHEPVGRGFDWRPAVAMDGILQFRSSSRDPHDTGWSIEFSGRQPELCDLITQYVVLEPGREYALDVAGSWPAGAAAGLSIHVASGEYPVSLARSRFKAIKTLDQIVLRYRRVPGQTRFEGRVDVRNISLAPLGDR